MARSAAVLGVHLMSAGGDLRRVGSLLRDRSGVTFVVDDLYLRTPDRPTLSLRWIGLEGEADTLGRLTSRSDKYATPGLLPAWFSGLLPEGALRDLFERDMGPGDHDYFDVLARLGADLPGAVVILPETRMDDDLGAVRWDRVGGLPAPLPDGVVKFSLAGVQLKFTAVQQGERLTMPGRSGEGRLILKAPTPRYPRLPETEYAAMTLCAAAGVDIAPVRLVSMSDVLHAPAVFREAGDFALAVTRFDRTETGRVHIEDAAQIFGAVGERKYTMANAESVMNAIRRFSADWRADLAEGFRRLAADILIGNGDNHLKNWSFRFPDGVRVRLSPAYDIVPTVLYAPRDALALQILGTRTFENIGLAKFRRMGAYLGLGEARAEAVVREVVDRALSLWPAMMESLPLTDDQRLRLWNRLDGLTLVRETKAAGAARPASDG